MIDGRPDRPLVRLGAPHAAHRPVGADAVDDALAVEDGARLNGGGGGKTEVCLVCART